MEQSETAGSVIEKNKTIIMTVSKGPERIQVPESIEGSELEDATEALDELGLKWEVTYEYSGKDIGIVISCTPNERAAVSKNNVIKLIVSRGQKDSGENTISIPNLVNKKEAKAEELITGTGFKVGEVRYEYSDTVVKGIVIRQSLKSGGVAPKGTSIGLVVSNGPESNGKYSATYTFALEDLYDPETGEPITEGTVSVLLNGFAQIVDEAHSDISKWQGDYTITLTGDEKGKGTVELLINGVIVKTDTVRLK